MSYLEGGKKAGKFRESENNDVNSSHLGLEYKPDQNLLWQLSQWRVSRFGDHVIPETSPN